jgi:hypothetical protein
LTANELLSKVKGKAMHLLLFTPLLASDVCVAPSGAAFIVILTIAALVRSRMG